MDQRVGFRYKCRVGRSAMAESLFYFESQDKVVDWYGNIILIKTMARGKVSAILARGGNDNLTVKEKEGQWKAWLDKVAEFINKYGKHCVPWDISAALNDTEVGLGRPATKFPAVHFVRFVVFES